MEGDVVAAGRLVLRRLTGGDVDEPASHTTLCGSSSIKTKKKEKIEFLNWKPAA